MTRFLTLTETQLAAGAAPGPPSPFVRVAPNSLTADCYHQIKQAILRLDFLPGTPLVEAQLATQLGTSKSPIREALLRLASEQLVLTSHGRSCVVAGLTIAKIREWYQVRRILEPASLTEIINLLTPYDIASLRAAIDATQTAHDQGDVHGFVRGSEAFHAQLIDLNPNRALAEFVISLLEQIRRVRVALYHFDRERDISAGIGDGIARHSAVVDALANHDLARAEAMLRHDVQVFLDRLETPAMLADLEQLTFRRR